MQIVGAAARHHVHIPTERPPEFGLPTGGDHLELLDCIHPVRQTTQPRRIVVGRQTVDDEAVREVALAAHREAHSLHRRRFREELRAVDVGRRHRWREHGDVEEVTTVERQVVDLLPRHGDGHLAAGRLQDGCVGAHGDGGGHALDGDHDGDVEGRAKRQRQATGGRREASLRNREFVRAHAQVREPIPAGVVRGGLDRHGGFDLPRRDEGAGDDGALRIGHPAADAGVVDGLLGLGRTGREENGQRGNQPAPMEEHGAVSLWTARASGNVANCRSASAAGRPETPAPRPGPRQSRSTPQAHRRCRPRGGRTPDEPAAGWRVRGSSRYRRGARRARGCR